MHGSFETAATADAKDKVAASETVQPPLRKGRIPQFRFYDPVTMFVRSAIT